MYCLGTKKGIDVSVTSKQFTEPETTEQPPEQRQPHEDAISKLFPSNRPPMC